jgi:IS5 family transposase
MIRVRHQQPSLWETFFAHEVAELWEPWMLAVDQLLEDDELLDKVYNAQGKRHKQSRTRGRHLTPAEFVLRMLILKHVRNWSYETRERGVRGNVVYRSFCRIGMEKVPDAKTLVRMGQAVGPEAIREVRDRLVEIAQVSGVNYFSRRGVLIVADHASSEGDSRRQDACGYDGCGIQHSLPH